MIIFRHQEVTLADLFHLPYATMLAQAGSEIMTTKGPNVTRSVQVQFFSQKFISIQVV
jgi:hypothetical protein